MRAVRLHQVSYANAASTATSDADLLFAAPYFSKTPEGRRSRSLVAIYKLLMAGFKDVYHVASGTLGWCAHNTPSALVAAGEKRVSSCRDARRPFSDRASRSLASAVCCFDRAEEGRELEGNDLSRWEGRKGLAPRT